MEEDEPNNDTKVNRLYKDELLKEAYRLKENNSLCDVTLRVNSRQFRANRAILAAGSPFFRCLFTTKMKENLSDEVKLEGLNVQVMQDVLKYIYTGEIIVTSENVEEIVKAADFLMITSLKEIGTEFLKRSLEPSQCFSVYAFAEKYNCKTLQEATIRFMCEHFKEVSKAEEFFSLEYKVVMKIFSSDDLVVSKEEEVYQTVIRWLKHDYEIKRTYLEKLFSCIRLSSMSTYYLMKTVQEEDMIVNNVHCLRHLLQAMCSLALSDRQNPRKCLVRDEVVIVSCGGYQFHGGNKDKRCFCYIPSLNQVKSLKNMSTARAEHSTAVCGNLLYAISTDGEKSNTGEVYNPRLNYWVPISKLPVKLNASSAVSLNDSLYVIGGCSDSRPSKRVFRYEPFNNKWTEAQPMRFAREELCSVAFEDSIYVFGGEGEGGEILRSVERYDPELDQWTDIVRMTRRRYCACASVVSGKVIVMGGHDGESVTSSCEIYDVGADQWSEIGSTCVPRQAAGVATVESKVYLMGGWDGNKYLDTMERYDGGENSWSVVGSIPFGRQAWIQCGVLHVPRGILGI